MRRLVLAPVPLEQVREHEPSILRFVTELRLLGDADEQGVHDRSDATDLFLQVVIRLARLGLRSRQRRIALRFELGPPLLEPRVQLER